MTVWIRDVEQETTKAGATRWVVYWAFERHDISSAGKCYTWDTSEASCCAEARHYGQRVELKTAHTQFGERIQAVSLVADGAST